MSEWTHYRQIEDRDCPSYNHCLTVAALADAHYVPCYECMGGVPVSYKFHCPKCKTLWVDEATTWLILKKTTCPFCNTTFKLSVVTNELGEPTATILYSGGSHVSTAK